MPTPLWKHCLLKINDTHLFMAGGADNEQRNANAYLLNIDAWVWTELPMMGWPRTGHGCALFDSNKVIVVGGFPAFVFRPRSDILSLDTLTWSAGPFDPTIYNKVSLIPYADSLLTVETGEAKSVIRRLDRKSNKFVDLFEVESFNGGTAMLLPDNYPVKCPIQS